jgi:hypothetical protein
MRNQGQGHIRQRARTAVVVAQFKRVRVRSKSVIPLVVIRSAANGVGRQRR